MIVVVSDTSAISALLHIGRIEILTSLYDEIIIPVAVQQEIKRAHHAIPAFIRVRRVIETPALRRRLSILDKGEACAITLAEQLNADLLLIDEKKGREEAERSRLTYIGLVGALLEAKRRGVVKLMRPLLEELVANAGFRLSPVLCAAVLDAASESTLDQE